MVIIVFTDTATPPGKRRRAGQIGAAGGSWVFELKQELQRNRKELQTTREEMQSSQEELRDEIADLQSRLKAEG